MDSRIHSKFRQMVALAAVVGMAPATLVAAQEASPPRAPLVACADAPANAPCSEVATSAAAIVGVWKQFFGGSPEGGGVGYIRYFADGSYNLADTPEHTAAPYDSFPRGSVRFDGEVMTISVAGEVPVPGCNRDSTFQVQVVKLGDRPVALWYQPIDDLCAPRLADLSQPLLWVAPN